MERLLGKSPLRLVVERTKVEKGVWKEKLECGHDSITFSQFDSRCQELPITAIRRRCPKCKPTVAPVFATKKEITAAQAQAALIYARKLQFGALFGKFCYENGELRPNETESELVAWAKTYTLKPTMKRVALGCAGRVDEEPNADGTSRPAPYEFPSPKKPVQSVRSVPQKRKAA
jgi:hypothetical protein